MIHLRGDAADVVVDDSTGAPTIVHWGAPLGNDIDLPTVVAALDRPVVVGAIDVVAPLSVVPEHGSGFSGRPGLAGRRPGGREWAPRFTPARTTIEDGRVVVRATDAAAGLGLVTEIELDHTLRVRVTLHNDHEARYLLDHLSVTLPLAPQAGEMLRFDGRWAREFQATRQPLVSGAFTQENRSGRPSQDHVPLLFVGSEGFGEWCGEVWGAHLAWSGNWQLLAEVLPDGRRLVQFGELLHPGEVSLAPGESYSTPWLHATYSAAGLTPASWGFHRWLRSRPGHPTRPRPVLVNTWEAVYFDHDLGRLQELAAAAAAIGAERYVLDDGWFGSRRDDTSGLGDWEVSPMAHPQGLAPLIDHVRGLGMEFGIWVEPEMVNPDSDLYRAHPEWALTDARYQPVMARNQLVLDLAVEGAYTHVRDRLHALLRDHDIAFVKWDMNRHHVHGSGADGAAGTHAQTLAVYRLLDELRALHPGVEIESCSSGGGRVDFAILERTDRVWTSDCNDALERQAIQRGASLLITPELMGAHIGPPRAHTTGRTHSLAFRGLTALFGHLGVEWDFRQLDDGTRQELTDLVALHKRFRGLLHSGDAVRFDVPGGGPGAGAGPQAANHAYGVYAADRSEALVAYVQLRTGISLVPPVLRLPGLDPDARYLVREVPLPRQPGSMGRTRPAWIERGVVLSGRQLAAHGLQPPSLNPESGALIHLTIHLTGDRTGHLTGDLTGDTGGRG